MRALIIIFLLLSYCLFPVLQAAEENTTTDIYAYTHANMFSPAVKNALFRVYVPNGKDGTVTVIDPTTYQVIETFHCGKNPQHVVPSYDLQTLWVLNNRGNSLTPIDPTTAKPGKNIAVDDPYNLYFTPDGQFAIVVCEARKQLEFRDPKTMALHDVVPIQCSGANHMDFTVDGKYGIVTCEFSGKLIKVDLINRKVVGNLSLIPTTPKPPQIIVHLQNVNFVIAGDGHVFLPNNMGDLNNLKNNTQQKSMPQDIRSSADGSMFLVADMMRDGVVLIDPINFTEVGFIPTGIGTHAVYPSRDGKLFYVSNRGCHMMRKCGPHGPGSISVIDPTKHAVIANWPIPGGGSPDMGNVSADGKELWLSGRYDNEVYVFDTASGNLIHRIHVGTGPHGLAVWPQPGRYSLGHTGNMR